MVKWRKIATQEIFKHPRIHFVEDEVLLPDDSKTNYLRQINLPDYVTVIARHNGKIVLIRDYSYPNDAMLLQFSEGQLKDGETPEQAAIRELMEETGLRAKHCKLLGTHLHDHRRSTARCFVFFADETEEGPQYLEPEELGTETVLLTEREVAKKIAAGELKQKNALAAWATYISTK